MLADRRISAGWAVVGAWVQAARVAGGRVTARRGDDVFVLVGEGYMPAQDFHVELGPEAGWWPWTSDGLALPHWPLPKDALRRWKEQAGT